MLIKLRFVPASERLIGMPALACLALCLHKALNGKLKIVRLQKNIFPLTYMQSKHTVTTV